MLKSQPFLRRNLHGCTQDIKHIAYNTLVRPTLEYCTTIWDSHASRNIDRLEQAYTKAARYITVGQEWQDYTLSEFYFNLLVYSRISLH